MVSGFFLGGMAPGITQGANAFSNDMKLQSLMQLQVAQQQSNQKHSDFMKLRADAVQHLNDTISQLKIAHPELSPMQLASNPAVVSLKDMIGGFDKNLKLPNTIDSIVASLAEQPSKATTAKSMAAATGELGLRQSEAAKNNAQAKVLNQSASPPDVASGDDKKLLTSLATKSGMTPEELDVMGQARAAGNSSVLQNLGRGKQGGEAVKAVNAWAIHSLMQQGLSPAEAAAKLNENTVQFGANKVGAASGARTAGTREANLSIILDTAGSAVDAAVQASDALPRGEFVPANKAIQAAQAAGSNPQLKVFAQKNLQLAELWAKSMNPTGTMRESDRELALSILSTADSPETYKTVAASIKASIGLEKKAAIGFLKDRGIAVKDNTSSDGGVTVHGFTFTPTSQ